jgi:hypothetical protein
MGRTARERLRDEDDWSIEWTGCGCGLCGTLGTFLGSRSRAPLDGLPVGRYQVDAGSEIFGSAPAEAGSGVVADPANRTQIEIDALALMPRTASRARTWPVPRSCADSRSPSAPPRP